MFGLENGGKTLIFMSRHFDETMTFFDFAFLRIGAVKQKLTGGYFMLRLNKMKYIPNKKIDVLFISVFFPGTCPTSIFSPFIWIGWRPLDRITYQQVND